MRCMHVRQRLCGMCASTLAITTLVRTVQLLLTIWQRGSMYSDTWHTCCGAAYGGVTLEHITAPACAHALIRPIVWHWYGQCSACKHAHVRLRCQPFCCVFSALASAIQQLLLLHCIVEHAPVEVCAPAPCTYHIYGKLFSCSAIFVRCMC
jgi:hypothetical protein